MAQNKLLFKEVTDYSSFLEIVNKNIEPIHALRFFREPFSAAKAALKSANEKTQATIMSYAFHIDKSMNQAGQANCNAFNKIPTLMAGVLYIRKYPDSIRDFSLDEIKTLSLYSTTMPLAFFQTAQQYFPKQLIEAVNEKTADYQGRNFLMYLTEKYFNLNQTPEQITAYYKNSSFDELLDDFSDYGVQKEAEELAKLERKGQTRK